MQNPKNTCSTSHEADEKAQDKKKVVLLAGPVVLKLRPGCPTIGGVAYPPYLIQWDKAQEGEAEVRERLHRRHSEERQSADDADRALAARLLGVCCQRR